MRDNSLKTFIRETYSTKSPVPYLITIQIALFILIHIFDLMQELGFTSISLYDKTVNILSLPSSFSQFILQPWSIISYSFVNIGLFTILFNCLWLYWISTIFLNFLNDKQLSFIIGSSIILTAILYLTIGEISSLHISRDSYLISFNIPLAALVSSIVILVPNMQIRLLLLGSIQFKYVAIVYIVLQCSFFVMSDKIAAIVFLLIVAYGILFTYLLNKGVDLSKKLPKFSRTKKLKVVARNNNLDSVSITSNYYPDQETVDKILDKISSSGYDSLTSNEKETLFKASQK